MYNTPRIQTGGGSGELSVIWPLALLTVVVGAGIWRSRMSRNKKRRVPVPPRVATSTGKASPSAPAPAPSPSLPQPKDKVSVKAKPAPERKAKNPAPAKGGVKKERKEKEKKKKAVHEVLPAQVSKKCPAAITEPSPVVVVPDSVFAAAMTCLLSTAGGIRMEHPTSSTDADFFVSETVAVEVEKEEAALPDETPSTPSVQDDAERCPSPGAKPVSASLSPPRTESPPSSLEATITTPLDWWEEECCQNGVDDIVIITRPVLSRSHEDLHRLCEVSPGLSTSHSSSTPPSPLAPHPAAGAPCPGSKLNPLAQPFVPSWAVPTGVELQYSQGFEYVEVMSEGEEDEDFYEHSNGTSTLQRCSSAGTLDVPLTCEFDECLISLRRVGSSSW